MTLPNDVDFQFMRRTHGWSEARLYIDGYLREEFILTHIFDDPLEAICTAFGLKKDDILSSKKEKVGLKVRKKPQKRLNQLKLLPIF